MSSRAFRILPMGLLAALGCGYDETPIWPFEYLTPVCHQTYEFGNYGCALIGGQVVGTRGQPLPGVYVIALGRNDTHGPFVFTDANGDFMIRVIRYGPPAIDTATAWVRAAGFGLGPPEPVDSVFVRFRLAPVGAIPDTLRLVITLDVP